MRSSEISKLTNEQLLASLKTMVGDERRAVATMLAYLAEVDERKLYAELGYSSTFVYCQRRLGMSEDQTGGRIAVARLGRRFPLFVQRRLTSAQERPDSAMDRAPARSLSLQKHAGSHPKGWRPEASLLPLKHEKRPANS